MSLIDEKTVNHLAELLYNVQQPYYNQQDPQLVSGTIKKQYKDENNYKNMKIQLQDKNKVQRNWSFNSKAKGNSSCRVQNFISESKKLAEAGISFGAQFAQKLQIAITQLAKNQNIQQLKFWGLINGTQRNYFVLQGLRKPQKSYEQIPKGSEKEGEGVNYHSFWVSNDPFTDSWSLLPLVTIEHINVARKIKKYFTGNLNAQICSEPKFPGTQKFYLKAQLCRITHSLELVPNGIYKQNDDNPKFTQFQDEVKLPQFAEASNVQSWVHRNQMILALGRCSHYIDPALNEEQIEAKTTYLNQNDPQIPRLRGIAEDKVPEALNMGIQNPWILKVGTNNQVFTKDENSLVYGICTLKNVFWPGWLTIGYRQGFCNIYIGNGHKLTQSAWDQFTNPDLADEGDEIQQQSEPNPKQQVKQQVENKEQQNNDD